MTPSTYCFEPFVLRPRRDRIGLFDFIEVV